MQSFYLKCTCYSASAALLGGIACFTACARLHLLIPSNLLQSPLLQQLHFLALCCSNMLKCNAIWFQPLHCCTALQNISLQAYAAQCTPIYCNPHCTSFSNMLHSVVQFGANHCISVLHCNTLCSNMVLSGLQFSAAHLFLHAHLFSQPRTTHLRCTPLSFLITMFKMWIIMPRP